MAPDGMVPRVRWRPELLHALGHTKATFSEPAFEQHLLGGLAWVADQAANSQP